MKKMLYFCLMALSSYSLCYSQEISNSELNEWDSEVDRLGNEKPLIYGETNRLEAYLYNAQRAFAEESLRRSRTYKGSLNPISEYVIQLFYPDYKSNNESDAYSRQIANSLFKKIDDRFATEQKQMRPFKLQEKENSWNGTKPFLGIKIPSMNPWILKSPDEFRLPPTPTDQAFWDNQITLLKKNMENLTDDKMKKIYFWAGMSGQGSGDWIAIANKYMEKNNVPLEKRLQVRAVLATAMCDAAIAAFDSKYTYLIRRPFMMDPSIKPVIDTPNHPSYPAGHSVLSSAAATVLIHYFPENRKEWESLAYDAGMSRIWAGIHWPNDNIMGNQLGIEVGKATIQRFKQVSFER